MKKADFVAVYNPIEKKLYQIGSKFEYNSVINGVIVDFFRYRKTYRFKLFMHNNIYSSYYIDLLFENRNNNYKIKRYKLKNKYIKSIKYIYYKMKINQKNKKNL